MLMKHFSKHWSTNFNWMYDTDWNLSSRKVFFSSETHLCSVMTEERLTGLTMSVHYVECLSLKTETVAILFCLMSQKINIISL